MIYRNRWEVILLRRLVQLRVKPLARLWRAVLGVDLGDEWPKDLVLPHPWGVVIHADARIGVHCVLYQGVTLGANIGSSVAPTIGDRVRVFANATVVGGIKIGDDVIIGANSVVVKDVPAGVVVVGNPARTLRPLMSHEYLSSEDFGRL